MSRPRVPFLPTVNPMKLAKAQAEKAWGRRVTRAITFGPRSRFAVFGVLNRFGDVSWFIQDAETTDEAGMPAIVAQAAGSGAIRLRMAELIRQAEAEEAE